MRKGKENKVYAVKNRPGDVAGDTLLSRVKSIRDANEAAGVNIDRVAKTLKGQPVNISAATKSFSNDLDDLGVKFKQNKEGNWIPNFVDSQLAPGDRGPIKEVIRQMNLRGKLGTDALDVHEMKRVIDDNVTFGKTKTGISGDGERVLKSFRNKLDEALDTSFPEYNKVNTQYSETINALNSIQDIAGQKMDLSGGKADKALGTLLRRTMSNAQSRVSLLDAIDKIEFVARKHGGGDRLRITGPSNGTDDLLNQVLFFDELDRVFGSDARTSLQGQFEHAGKRQLRRRRKKGSTLMDIATDVTIIGVDEFRGVNEKNAFKAIEELLKR